ncbi:MAG: glycosyltransferase [Candidatus Rokubacteria bacterium]|nr:glycosyltransferase [Candidatus Rokubacteria bacterium]
MRLLLAIHNVYTDYTSGAAHSVRILMQWLTEAGHECRVLATARFDARPPDIDEHLAKLGVPLRRTPPSPTFIRSVRKPRNVVAGRPTVHFTLDAVPVTMLMTRQNGVDRPDPLESAQYLYLFDEMMQRFRPDLLLAYGAHPVVREAMRRARRRGVVTVFTLRNRGYEDRRWFKDVDHVLTTSPFLTEYYRQTLGLVSTGIESPIAWSEVLAPTASRAFVTFVNPSLAKGAAVFARLADMLGSERPDIPILVVQSAADAGILTGIPGIDFGQYPQIMAAPPTPRPADFFALTRILLVPSVFPEPFGRVAAEAMINGIPPLVSNRGSLPQTVAGAGRVLPIPEWLTEATPQLPSAEEVRPWFDAVCEWWDQPQRYAEASALARQTAERLYSEPVLRQRYLDYFASLRDGQVRAPVRGTGDETRALERVRKSP